MYEALRHGLPGAPFRVGQHWAYDCLGGTGKIETQKSLVTEVPIRGFYSYYCELMGFADGAEAAAE